MYKDDIYRIFDSDGLLSNSITSFEFREDQLNMALDINSCYENNNVTVVEAGTGIGKSFSYLVPTLLRAYDDPKEKTVIATSTINLQRQLLKKDIPMLFEMFSKKVSVAIGVGRNNYLCLRRLSNLLNSMSVFDAQNEESDIAKINNFSNSTKTGLRSDYEGRLDAETWNKVCSDGDFCLGPKCPYYSQCFYFKAKQQLNSASIIICNHHLLFTDSNARLEAGIGYDEDCILPPFEHLVIDEAHNIEKHATDLFTSQYSSLSLKRQLDSIYDSKFVNNVSVRLLDVLNAFAKDDDLYKQIIDFMILVSSQADSLNLTMLNLLQMNGLLHLLVTRENSSRVFEKVRETAKELTQNIARLVGRLTVFASKVSTTEQTEAYLKEFNSHLNRISQINEILRNFLEVDNWNDDVHYLEIERRQNVNYVCFNIAPIDVAPVLKEALFKKIPSIVCTSATLDLKDDFNYWSRSVGLPIEGKNTVRKVYKSPFDYKNRLMLLTPYDCVDFNNENQDEYAQFLCKSIYSAVSSSNGGALILFTSIKLMDYVYSNLLPRFEALELHCMKQGDTDRYSLLEHFKQDKDSILFATDSFWEGVDAPGDTLRMVIITKLPFTMPDEPIYKARYKRLENMGQSGFFSLSLPEATMKLKQGYGRLMRHTEDRGIVLILDSRIVKKSYGAMMLSSLPESYYPEVSLSTMEVRIESFLF